MPARETSRRGVIRTAVLRLVGGAYLAAGVAGGLFSAYMSDNAFEVDRRRCGTLPNEYYPELFWLLMSLPAAILVAVAGGAVIASASVRRPVFSVGAAALLLLATSAAAMLLPWWSAARSCPGVS